jgi:hypothetical protein
VIIHPLKLGGAGPLLAVSHRAERAIGRGQPPLDLAKSTRPCADPLTTALPQSITNMVQYIQMPRAAAAGKVAERSAFGQLRQGSAVGQYPCLPARFRNIQRHEQFSQKVGEMARCPKNAYQSTTCSSPTCSPFGEMAR